VRLIIDDRSARRLSEFDFSRDVAGLIAALQFAANDTREIQMVPDPMTAIGARAPKLTAFKPRAHSSSIIEIGDL